MRLAAIALAAITLAAGAWYAPWLIEDARIRASMPKELPYLSRDWPQHHFLGPAISTSADGSEMHTYSVCRNWIPVADTSDCRIVRREKLVVVSE